MNRIAFAVGLLMLVGCGAEPEGGPARETAAAEAKCQAVADNGICSATYQRYQGATATVVHRDGPRRPPLSRSPVAPARAAPPPPPPVHAAVAPPPVPVPTAVAERPAGAGVPA